MLIASSLLLIYTHAYILLNKDNEENVLEDLYKIRFNVLWMSWKI